MEVITCTTKLQLVHNLYIYIYIIQSEEGRKVIRNYNKMASVLLEYEMLYHRGWFKAVETARSGIYT